MKLENRDNMYPFYYASTKYLFQLKINTFCTLSQVSHLLSVVCSLLSELWCWLCAENDPKVECVMMLR